MSTDIKKAEHAKDERFIVPTGDIYETDNEYTLKLEMPGVNKDRLEILLENNDLEITGRIEKEENADSSVKRYSEYRPENYYRKFIVGNDIDRNKIDARLDEGILTLILQKSEEVKPKKIPINVN